MRKLFCMMRASALLWAFRLTLADRPWQQSHMSPDPISTGSSLLEAHVATSEGTITDDSTMPSAQQKSKTQAAELPLNVSKRLVWLEYLFPSGAWWDVIHDGHVNDGGLWNYKSSVQAKLEQFLESRHPHYESLWDVASNQGFFLERLAQQHPTRTYFGSDISTVMVNATKTRCTTCKTEVFYLGLLQEPHFRLVPHHIPQPVDIVVVADVLCYMSWGGWPPILNSIIPESWTRSHRENFWRHLTQLARKEVIFSNHQGNKGVMRFFHEMGAKMMQDDDGYTFWVAPGAFGTATLASQQSGSISASDVMTPRLFIILVCGFVAFCCLISGGRTFMSKGLQEKKADNEETSY